MIRPMEIEVKLYAGLEKAVGRTSEDRAVSHPITAGMTVRQVLVDLGVPLDQAKLILVNGRHADTTTELSSGDRLVVFPPVGGG